MTVAERIDALMPESIQAAIPSGGMIFNQSKHPGVHFYVILVTKITIKTNVKTPPTEQKKSLCNFLPGFQSKTLFTQWMPWKWEVCATFCVVLSKILRNPIFC